MKPTLTLVGRARNLAFDAATGVATWSLFVDRGLLQFDVFKLTTDRREQLEQFERMDEGSLIGVIAELPLTRRRGPGVPLKVQRLELLGKPKGVA